MQYDKHVFIHKGFSQRIDLSLKSNLSIFSRNFLRILLKDGRVLVNNHLVTKSNVKVKDQDLITVDIPKQKTIKISSLSLDTTLDIIDEQEDFLIINKPAGILTHPATTSKDLISIASMIVDKIAFSEESPFSNRAGIVHRLDKDTSGLLIIAKNFEAQNRFATIFQNREITKRYLAISSGIPKTNSFVIETPIGRDPKNPIKMRPYGIAAKPACSNISVVKSYKQATLLNISITTGRTHQIRVHLASLGLPILGDIVYGIKSPLINRQALHAHYLAFTYQNKFFKYTSELPADMAKVLVELEKY